MFCLKHRDISKISVCPSCCKFKTNISTHKGPCIRRQALMFSASLRSIEYTQTSHSLLSQNKCVLNYYYSKSSLKIMATFSSNHHQFISALIASSKCPSDTHRLPITAHTLKTSPERSAPLHHLISLLCINISFSEIHTS
jgi:hypothetical protein